MLAFLRISTHPRLLESPFSLDEAVRHITSWLERPMVDLLHTTPGHWNTLQRLLGAGQAGGNLVPDAHLAALTIEHGATLYSTDQDFSRFDGLHWSNPLR